MKNIPSAAVLPAFAPKSLAPYQKILDSLCETASSSDYVRDMKIFEQLTALLSLLMQDSWHPGSTAKPTSRKYNLQQIKDYLDFHYPETIRLDDLAETFYINKFSPDPDFPGTVRRLHQRLPSVPAHYSRQTAAALYRFFDRKNRHPVRHEGCQLFFPHV